MAENLTVAVVGATGQVGAVMRRLAALPPDLGPAGIGLVICDASGTLTFRRAARQTVA